MRGETKIVHGDPRTKGMRNAYVASARAKRGGAHKNPRDKRRAQKDRAYERSAEG
jgi:hypothetical protein